MADGDWNEDEDRDVSGPRWVDALLGRLAADPRSIVW